MKESTLPISEFKAKCLRLMEEVAEQGSTLIITKRGRPLAKVSPISPPRNRMWGSWKGFVKIKRDIVSFHDDWSEDQ